MADLTGQQLKNSYQNLVTIDATIESNPTSGQLENGLGNPITALGIGTDSPSTTLHLDVTSGDNIISAVADAGNSAIFLSSAGSGKDNRFAIGNGKDLIFETTATSTPSATGTERMRISGAGDISFRDGATNEAFYWDASAGSLGIGTTSETYGGNTLNLVGAHKSFSSVAGGNLAIYTSDSQAINKGGSIALGGSYSGTIGYQFAGIAGLKENATDGNAQGYLALYTTNSSNSTIERLRIDSSGNITHSGTSPQYIFKTASNTNFQIAVQENVSNALEITPSTTAGGTTFSNPALVVNSSGNVGINETSPSAKLEITGTDTEPLTVLNDTVYTFAANVSTAQSNTHTVTIPFTSQGANHSNFLVEIYASLNWAAGASTTFAGRALYTLNTFTSVSNVAELEDVNNSNLSFSATSSGMDFIVTITTTATAGQEPDRIGVMAKVIRGNGLVGNEPISMTIA